MYAHYCLHKLKLLPSAFLGLPRRERAFIIASIDAQTEREGKARKEAERKMKRR